jgi:hypothetical protein
MSKSGPALTRARTTFDQDSRPGRTGFEIDQMTINIEKMRADMTAENRRFAVQAVGVASAYVAAGAALATLLLHLLGKI